MKNRNFKDANMVRRPSQRATDYLAVLVFACILISGCRTSDEASRRVRLVAQIKRDIEGNFGIGMSLADVSVYFDERGKTLEIFNICHERLEWPLSPCNKGYAALGILSLGGAGSSRRDQAQIYLTFDSKLVLTHYSYDFHFDADH